METYPPTFNSIALQKNQIDLCFDDSFPFFVFLRTPSHYDFSFEVKQTENISKAIEFISPKINVKSENIVLLNIKTKEKIENFNAQLNYNSEQYEKMRKIGENETLICQLIRNDSNDDFISFVNHSNLSLTATIESSIFETNTFLMKCKPTLIEYAAFYGSVKIFKYLLLMKIEKNRYLALFAVAGGNNEIIHICEQNKCDFRNAIKIAIMAQAKETDAKSNTAASWERPACNNL